MGVGVYGNIRPADVSINDIDVYYTYAATRSTQQSVMEKLSTEDIISYMNDSNDEHVEGMYSLTLPSTTFNQLGIYNIFIKPKKISLTIEKCGVLSSSPNIRGLVVNTADLDAALITSNALQGYRIEYYDTTLAKIKNVSRFITASYKVSPVTEIVGGNQSSIRYNFDENGTLLFLQVTPSTASDIKPNTLPFIGNTGQKIQISNTFFNPLQVEIEFVKTDLDKIYTIIAGNQIRNVERGLITYLNDDDAIIEQFNAYEYKNEFTQEVMYEIKEKRTDIDTTQTIGNVENE